MGIPPRNTQLKAPASLCKSGPHSPQEGTQETGETPKATPCFKVEQVSVASVTTSPEDWLLKGGAREAKGTPAGWGWSLQGSAKARGTRAQPGEEEDKYGGAEVGLP